MFSACMVAPATTMLGVGTVVFSAVIWAGLCRPPFKVVRVSLSLGLVLFLPYFVLVPLIRAHSPSSGWLDALAAPWAVFLRGIVGMQVTISTATTLSASDLRRGMIGLPIPDVITAVLLQIVHQTHTLLSETRRISGAIAVRGGSAGLRTGLRLIVSLPRLWLPRIIHRAERVAAAMEMRGYCQHDLRAMGVVSGSCIDAIAVGFSVVALAGAIALRLWGVA